MRELLIVMMIMLCWVATASAARLYLKDGSWIQAKRVWREKGKVVALVTRDTMTSFPASEVNLKKTFPPRKKVVKPIEATQPQQTATPAQAAVSGQPVAEPKKDGKKISIPALPVKIPEREPPKAAEEGAIRKHQREMKEKTDF